MSALSGLSDADVHRTALARAAVVALQLAEDGAATGSALDAFRDAWAETLNRRTVVS